MRRSLFAVVLLLASIGNASAQSPQAAPAKAPEPAIRRWFEFQQLVLSTRYRLIRNSADVNTSNHQQYREQIRMRVNFDAKKRYGLVSGLYSGSSFIATWNNVGPGTGEFDGRNHYMRQLYLTATPVAGVEGQVGGIYVSRGESTEYTSYDDDGYIVGGRVSVRRPKSLYFDELSVTRGAITQTSTPSVWKRWEDFDIPNYTQVLASKRLSQMVSASVDYTRHAERDTLRGAVALRFKASAPIQSLRYEQYVRTTDPGSAAGFSVAAERTLNKWARLQAGYVTIDELYGGLNSDRIQRGRRVFALGNITIHGPLAAQIFVTHALDAPYTISNKTRFDAVLSYDLAAFLRSTGKF